MWLAEYCAVVYDYCVGGYYQLVGLHHGAVGLRFFLGKICGHVVRRHIFGIAFVNFYVCGYVKVDAEHLKQFAASRRMACKQYAVSV